MAVAGLKRATSTPLHYAHEVWQSATEQARPLVDSSAELAEQLHQLGRGGIRWLFCAKNWYWITYVQIYCRHLAKPNAHDIL
jgi:hypothetical protein